MTKPQCIEYTKLAELIAKCWQLILLGAIVADQFEPLPVVLVVDEHVPVEQADASKGQHKQEHPEPDQLEDAPMPHKDHLPLAEKRFSGKNMAQ